MSGYFFEIYFSHLSGNKASPTILFGNIRVLAVINLVLKEKQQLHF